MTATAKPRAVPRPCPICGKRPKVNLMSHGDWWVQCARDIPGHNVRTSAESRAAAVAIWNGEKT